MNDYATLHVTKSSHRIASSNGCISIIYAHHVHSSPSLCHVFCSAVHYLCKLNYSCVSVLRQSTLDEKNWRHSPFDAVNEATEVHQKLLSSLWSCGMVSGQATICELPKSSILHQGTRTMMTYIIHWSRRNCKGEECLQDQGWLVINHDNHNANERNKESPNA